MLRNKIAEERIERLTTLKESYNWPLPTSEHLHLLKRTTERLNPLGQIRHASLEVRYGPLWLFGGKELFLPSIESRHEPSILKSSNHIIRSCTRKFGTLSNFLDGRRTEFKRSDVDTSLSRCQPELSQKLHEINRHTQAAQSMITNRKRSQESGDWG